MPKITIDGGNGDYKWFDGKIYKHFRHAIAFLTENQWRSVVGRSKTPPKGYIRVNGVPCAVGDAARRHVIKERPSGAARYHEAYAGVLAANVFAEAFEKSSKSVTVYASYAPQDDKYARDLEIALKRQWEVESFRGSQTFTVTRVETIDEPLCGLNHYVLTKAGRERANNPLKDKTCLVVDVGHHTVDVVAVDPGGVVDLESLGSTRTGVGELKKNFERELRANNQTRFKDTGDIDPRRIEQALITGKYPFGKLGIECREESGSAILSLINEIIDIISAAGGAANFDIILLTGGGPVLVYEALSIALPTIEFIMVEPERELMRYANAFGSWKNFEMLERIGAL